MQGLGWPELTGVAAGLVALAAILAAAAPRRWLALTLLGWIVSPVVIWIALVLHEAATRPTSGNPLHTAFVGLMIVSPFVIVPWGVLCALGFALGFALRALVRRRPSAVAIPKAVAAPARAADPVETRLSPDGAIRVDLGAVEWANTHWVFSPRVVEVATGRVVLDLWGTDWDAVPDFPAEGRVTLSLRRYHHGGNLVAELDLRRGVYRVVSLAGGDGPLPEAPLDGVAEGLEAASRQASAYAARYYGINPRPQIRQHPLAAWRTALLLLLGAAVAIGAAGYAAYRAEQPRPALTPMPVMPPLPERPPAKAP